MRKYSSNPKSGRSEFMDKYMKIKNIKNNIKNENNTEREEYRQEIIEGMPERYTSNGQYPKRYDLHLNYYKSEYGTSTFLKEKGYYNDPKQQSEKISDVIHIFDQYEGLNDQHSYKRIVSGKQYENFKFNTINSKDRNGNKNKEQVLSNIE